MQPPLGETEEEQQIQYKKEERYLNKTAGRISVSNLALKTGS